MVNTLLNILEDKSSNTGLQGLVELLFKAQNETHITHILQRKKLLCEHTALATFYEEIDPLIDSLAETCMAHGLINNITIPVSKEIMDTENYFVILYNEVEKYRKDVSNYSFLNNKIDEIQELISQTLYRLKFIKS